MDATVEAEAAERIVEMCGIAGKQRTAVDEGLRDALMHAIDALVADLVRLVARHQQLHGALDIRRVEQFGIGFLRVAVERGAPQAGRAVVRHLEHGGPFDRV